MRNFWKSLAVVVVGNAAYFLLMPYLPAAVRHAPERFDLGLAIDLWFCLVAYGVIDLVQRRRSRSRGEPTRK